VVARARAICETCPVIIECLIDVLAVPGTYDEDGTRGGLLPAERQDLRADSLRVAAKVDVRDWLGGPVTDVWQRWD
jgi:hypothetical protein